MIRGQSTTFRFCWETHKFHIFCITECLAGNAEQKCTRVNGVPEVLGRQFLAKQNRCASHSIANDPAAFSHPRYQLECVVAPFYILFMVSMHESGHHSVKGRKRLSPSIRVSNTAVVHTRYSTPISKAPPPPPPSHLPRHPCCSECFSIIHGHGS